MASVASINPSSLDPVSTEEVAHHWPPPATDVALWDTAVPLATREASKSYRVSHCPCCLHLALWRSCFLSSYFSVSLPFSSAPTRRWKGKASGSWGCTGKEEGWTSVTSLQYSLSEGGRRKGQGEIIKPCHCLNLEDGDVAVWFVNSSN